MPLPKLCRSPLTRFTALSAPLIALAIAAPTMVHAAPVADVPAASAEETLLASMGAQDAVSADGAVWSPEATGFASTASHDLPEGTTGGAGGETVVVRDVAGLTAAAASPEPLTILVKGTLTVGDGDMIDVAADKTIAGTADGGEIVDGGLRVANVENVVIRNLTFRDSFMAGDWDGKLDENDNDGIRVDTSDHVWVDHNEFERLGDGQLDIRKDSTNVTASWNYFHDHNKTLGVGWTDNLETTLTLHHNRFANVHQRNASLDKIKFAHVYNNWISGASSYGMSVRGGTTALIENSVFEHAQSPLLLDSASSVNNRGNEFTDVWGKTPGQSGPTFEASDFYDYTADATSEVTGLLTKYTGTSQTPKTEKLDDTVTVAQDGTGDFLSVHAAVGAASRVDHPVEILVEPGVYKEVVSVWPGADELTIRGATDDATDVTITYTWPPTLSVYADDVTIADVTLENTRDEDSAALRTVGERTVLEDVVIRGTHDQG